MWILTTIGFFSVVRKPGDKILTIRARCGGDLDRLRAQFMPTLSATITGAGTDYPVRGTISPADFAQGLAQMGESIDYANFKDAVAQQMGKHRAGLYSQVWLTLQGIEDEPIPPALALKPGVKYSFGGVLVRDGKVLLREPKDHFDGYAWTFSKGHPDPGETPEQTALREVLEETGIVARIERLIPGEFKGGTGMTIFYLMSVAEDTGELEDETSSVTWVTPAEARKLISMTTNPIGRKRDLAVLEALAL